MTIRAILIFNNHGNPRISKFYSQLAVEQQQALIQLIFQLVSRRDDKNMCNFLDAPELTALLPPPSVDSRAKRSRSSVYTNQSKSRLEREEEDVGDPWISFSSIPSEVVTKKHRRWRPDDELRVIYRHYATLYFVLVVDQSESELGILDLIQVCSNCLTQVIVESLDRCFENVCELDLIFHFDQIVQGGLVLDTSISEIVSEANAVNQARKASVRSGAGALGAFGGAPTMSSYLAPSSLVQNLSSPSLGSWPDGRSGMDLLQQVGSYYMKLTNSNAYRHRDP